MDIYTCWFSYEFSVSQRKNALDILEENALMNSKSVDTHMDLKAKLLPNQREPLTNPKKHRRSVRKLNSHIVTCPDISFTVIVVSKFLNSLCVDH